MADSHQRFSTAEGSSKLHVVQAIRKRGLEWVMRKYRLKMARHSDHPQLVQLHYDQLKSPLSSPIVQECRGVILDESANYAVVHLPFTKFFNASESGAACIDWETATVFEKLDGSMVSLYWYDGKWHVASSSLPDGSGAICGSGRFSKETSNTEPPASSPPVTPGALDEEADTAQVDACAPGQQSPVAGEAAFVDEHAHPGGQSTVDEQANHSQRTSRPQRPSFAETFWELWSLENYTLPSCSASEPSRYSFVFELMSPHNRILVEVGPPRVCLIGVRDLHTLREVNVCEFAKQCGWRTPPVFTELNSHAAVVEACRLLNPMQQEGFVVTDAHFSRVKFKSPQYVALSLMRGLPNTYTPRRILQVLLANEGSEFLAYFPELGPTYTRLSERLQLVCREADAEFARLNREYEGTRGWYIASAESPHCALLRVMRRGDRPAIEVMRAAKCKQVEAWLGPDAMKFVAYDQKPTEQK
eukprot:CAMPEP_0174238278 /NCGR_PEP_ID=MMETSP0417-20130205/10799_1 /TAXON_ID=242541 /ORGANISM="Mayorella sp, Strain BSH-02190019" /LENGTH=472 /DNA_ID=CAMNT_0015317099 /DNA_START=33 /DNA_END=1451 /DNA_ORIENTATION=+